MKRISLALVAMFALSPYAFAGEEIQLAAAIGSGAEAGGTMGGAGTTVGTVGAVSGPALTTAEMVSLGVIAASGLVVVAEAASTTNH